MPDFTFTSPQGKSYTVSGPEGATKEQAFQMLQSQISAGTAKSEAASAPRTPDGERSKFAATLDAADPSKKLDKITGAPTLPPTLKGAADAIGTSGAVGGILCAASAEILGAAAAGAGFFPIIGEGLWPTL